MSEDVDAVCSDFHMRDGTGLELLGMASGLHKKSRLDRKR